MLTSNGWFGAEGIENTGREIEPRNKYSCGHQDNRALNIECLGKPTACIGAEGSSLESDLASIQDTTGV